jgi:hypothetical protein
MTLRPFYLFYLLTILLLVSGLLTKDAEIITSSFNTTIIKGMWSFFIPAAVAALLTGLIYHYRFNSGRPVHKGTIILHFSLLCLGLLFSLNFYKLTIVLLSSGAPDTASITFNSLFFTLLGPGILILSLLVFIAGLIKTRRASN